MLLFLSTALCLFPGSPPTSTASLSLHDALPISCSCSRKWPVGGRSRSSRTRRPMHSNKAVPSTRSGSPQRTTPDRKSTRLNSSHLVISYAVFCLKKKKETGQKRRQLDLLAF